MLVGTVASFPGLRERERERERGGGREEGMRTKLVRGPLYPAGSQPW